MRCICCCAARLLPSTLSRFPPLLLATLAARCGKHGGSGIVAEAAWEDSSMSLGSSAPLQCFIVGRLLMPAHALHMAEYLPLSCLSPPSLRAPICLLLCEERRGGAASTQRRDVGLHWTCSRTLCMDHLELLRLSDASALFPRSTAGTRPRCVT